MNLVFVFTISCPEQANIQRSVAVAHIQSAEMHVRHQVVKVCEQMYSSESDAAHNPFQIDGRLEGDVSPIMPPRSQRRSSDAGATAGGVRDGYGDIGHGFLGWSGILVHCFQCAPMGR